LYNKLNAGHFTKGQLVRTATLSLRQGKVIDPSLMFNVFEKVAFELFPQLSEYRKLFEEAGAPNIHLAGSGPCLFAPFSEEGRANEVCLRLGKQGLESYVALSLPQVPS
jgi:4-diphosphocytidyl-2-C-methyl-D-erythritol kinase